MTRLKLCGLRREADMLLANRYRPDYVGFVFAPSRRQVLPEQAKELRAILNPAIPAVGVFVNAPLAEIVSLVEAGTIQLVQLHGDEDEAEIAALRGQIRVPIIKAVSVTGTDAILQAAQLPCDYLLLDTACDGRRGGSGKTWDRKLLPALEKPFFLAGGLDAENVAAAIADAHPYAVDISSGAERDGWKAEDKIETIMLRIAAANHRKDREEI